MHVQLTIKLRSQHLTEGRVAVQAAHFVFVLVGQQAVVLARCVLHHRVPGASPVFSAAALSLPMRSL
jgi:hypothetical protein